MRRYAPRADAVPVPSDVPAYPIAERHQHAVSVACQTAWIDRLFDDPPLTYRRLRCDDCGRVRVWHAAFGRVVCTTCLSRRMQGADGRAYRRAVRLRAKWRAESGHSGALMMPARWPVHRKPWAGPLSHWTGAPHDATP